MFNIFGFKADWRQMVTRDLQKILVFLTTKMTLEELQAEQIKLRKDLEAQHDRPITAGVSNAIKELHIQDGLLAAAILGKNV